MFTKYSLSEGKKGRSTTTPAGVSSINERLADQHVEVYAPVSWRDHAERNRLLNKMTPKLKDVISALTQDVHMNTKL
jgi:hypothetical protein